MSVYKKLARAVDKVARRAVDLERQEEARLRALSARLEETRVRSLTDASQAAPSVWRKRRALLIVNSKSGPNRDSLLRVRDLAELLAAYNIAVEVRVKLSKSQAAKDARAAADAGFELVIAAGGDGTVESVARGLVDTSAALGIVPLGTYNNIAHCLGVPTDPAAACALIASRSPRPIDVGEVEAHGRRKPRTFLELATVGLGAILTPLGQHVEKGRLIDAAELVPDIVNMAPSGMLMRLDNAPTAWWGDALLLTISNTPRAGAALQLAPDAHVDDGLLDIVLYDGLRQSDLLARVGELRNGSATQDVRLRHTRVRSIEVHTQQPMAVAADSKVVGVTPARFTVRTGALLAIVGHGPGLGRPPSAAVPLPILETASSGAPSGTAAEHARPLVPSQAARLVRANAVPLAAAVVAAAALPVARAVQKRVERR
jgi:diacylglycerol kinase (ATP)